MGHVYRGLVFGQAVEAFVYLLFRQGIQGRGGLIQHHDRAVLIESPGDHQLLLLPAGKFYALIVHGLQDTGVRAVLQSPHLVSQARLLDAFVHALPVNPLPVAYAHIVRRGESKGQDFLEYRRKAIVILLSVKSPDIDSVAQDFPLRHVI